MIKVVTFNLRYDNFSDAANRWQLRKGMILDRLEAEAPDLIGVQECLPEMGTFLKRHLADYLFVGCGRSSDYSGENNMIGLRLTSFELMGLETFWLSPTPHIPGSRYEDQSPCPRVCTAVLLRQLSGNRLLRYYHTHLDHASESARVLGAQAIMGRMKEHIREQGAELPVILTGDMNTTPGSPTIAHFTQDDEIPLTDQTVGLPSFHDFGKRLPSPQIDFILTRGLRAVRPSVAWNEKPYGFYLSDHHALCACLEME